MGTTQYPDEQRVRILGDSGEVQGLGGWKFAEHRELKWMRAMLHIEGTPSGSEQIRLSIYSKSDLGVRLFSSDWVDIADIGAGGTYWRGRVRFDFDRQFLNKNSRYYLAAETQNYTRTSSFSIGIEADWNTDKWDPATAGAARTWANLDFYGYKEGS